MKIYNKAVVLTSAVLALTIGSAAKAGPGYTTPSVVAAMNVRDFAVDVYVPAANNPMNCSTNGWVKLSTSTPNYNAMYAFVLTRLANHESLKFYINSCDSEGVPLAIAVGMP